MPRYVLDTNVYVRATRDAEWSRSLELFYAAFAPFVYLHSVVASEILAGATSKQLQQRTRDRFLRPFERRDRVFTPSHESWTRAAAVIAQLVRERRISPGEGVRRSLVNDCLIAASAREHGFVLVTENVRDFDLLSRILPLEYVAPWPQPE